MVQKQTEKQLKVNLHHLSCVDSEFKSFAEKALEHIWKNMHCSSIRLSLYHYEKDGKLQVDASLKNTFKALGFKWKTVTNDNRTGSRIELLECPNTTFKSQINPATSTLYRKGMNREDIQKEPLSFRLQAFLATTETKPQKEEAKFDHSNADSVIGLLNCLIQFKIENFIRDPISKLNEKLIKSSEVLSVLERAESLKKGNFLMPDSQS
jgi:hypothetical protein